jgi:hypothetical protein
MRLKLSIMAVVCSFELSVSERKIGANGAILALRPDTS